MRKKLSVGVLTLGLGLLGLYHASNWWERAYASLESSEFSPDGCMRLETYRPYWVLPSPFHRMPNPDSDTPYEFGMLWSHPTFVRAYEVSTGILLGETVVFDPAATNNVTIWNASSEPGRRFVIANAFPLVDSDRCADPESLEKLRLYDQDRIRVPPILFVGDEEAQPWE